MTNAQTLKQARERWASQCSVIQSMTTVVKQESQKDKLERIARAQKDYSYFVEYYFPHYAKCKCGKFQIEAANKVLKTQNLKGVFMWPRGHAKSTHFDIFIPLWLKIQKDKQLNVMVVVGKSEDSADVLLSDIQAELEFNARFISDFGKQKSIGSWETGEFVTEDNTAFFARGRGQSPRGLRFRDKRPDYIVIDDLDDDELCESQARVTRLTQWVLEALFGALDGGKGRFIMVGNLISRNSVLYNLSTNTEVFLSRINAIDKKGNPSWPEKYTKDQLAAMERFQGYRAYQKEMMNNPITEGAVFKNDWIRWGKMLPLNKYDHIVCYIDPSFKSSSKNDYKAAKVWGKVGTQLHHIKAFVRQCSIVEMVRWLYDFYEALPDRAVCDFYIEANFMQDMVLDEFEREGNLRGYQLPIRADKRKKPDKFLRIENISPLWERGFVTYNEKEKEDKDMKAGIDQTLAFEKGSRAHDDAPDADEGAISILQAEHRFYNFKPIVNPRSGSPKNLW